MAQKKQLTKKINQKKLVAGACETLSPGLHFAYTYRPKVELQLNPVL